MNKVIVPPTKEGEIFDQTDRAIPTSVRHTNRHLYDWMNDRWNVQVDLRASACMPAVKDQKECGSCWAHSANTPLEYQKCVKNAKNTALSFRFQVLFLHFLMGESYWVAGISLYSEQQLVDCASAYGNHGCNGGFYTYAWDYVKKAIGSQSYSSYPYTATVIFYFKSWSFILICLLFIIIVIIIIINIIIIYLLLLLLLIIIFGTFTLRTLNKDVLA